MFIRSWFTVSWAAVSFIQDLKQEKSMRVREGAVGQVRLFTPCVCPLIWESCSLKIRVSLMGEGVWTLMRSICCLLVCNYPNHPPTHPAPLLPLLHPNLRKTLTAPSLGSPRGGWWAVPTPHILSVFNVPCPWGPCKLPGLQRSFGDWQRGVTALSVFYKHSWGGERTWKHPLLGNGLGINKKSHQLDTCLQASVSLVSKDTSFDSWHSQHRNLEAPLYLVIFSVMKSLCLWVAVQQKQCILCLLVNVSRCIDWPRRHPGAGSWQALIHHTGGLLLVETPGSHAVENADTAAEHDCSVIIQALARFQHFV